jgi:hypothetical protein
MLPAILLTGCGTALDQQYQQLKAQLSGEAEGRAQNRRVELTLSAS